MKTSVIKCKRREDCQKAFEEWLKYGYVIVNISFFYDQIDETHKAVICYYE